MEYLIVGLGNPGLEYEKSRHNIGFYFIDELAEHLNAGGWREKWHGLASSASCAGRKIHLVKPQTYMNRSGECVARFYSYFKIKPENLLVLHDDLDMAPARVKLVKGGGAGGHNGIKSLVSCLGQRSFYRLKIGIGRPGKGGVHPDFPVEKFVLSDFSSEELILLDGRKDPFFSGSNEFLKGDAARAMGILNSLK